MTKLRVAVVGAGHLGKIHARLLQTQTDAQLVAVADPSSTAQQQIAKELGAPTVSDYRELFGQIDAAIVATPTRMHYEICLLYTSPSPRDQRGSRMPSSA